MTTLEERTYGRTGIIYNEDLSFATNRDGRRLTSADHMLTKREIFSENQPFLLTDRSDKTSCISRVHIPKRNSNNHVICAKIEKISKCIALEKGGSSRAGTPPALISNNEYEWPSEDIRSLHDNVSTKEDFPRGKVLTSQISPVPYNLSDVIFSDSEDNACLTNKLEDDTSTLLQFNPYAIHRLEHDRSKKFLTAEEEQKQSSEMFSNTSIDLQSSLEGLRKQRKGQEQIFSISSP